MLHAVIPDPHVAITFLFSSLFFLKNKFFKFFESSKKPFESCIESKGILILDSIFPFFSPFLGSCSIPANLAFGRECRFWFGQC